MAEDVQNLVARAQAGDGGAFGELYELYAPEIRRFLCRHLNGQQETAEDMTEDVFLKVLLRIGSYRRTGAPFSAWLYRVVRNHLIDYIRQRAPQVSCSLEMLSETREPRSEDDMDQALARNELESAVGSPGTELEFAL